MILAGDIGGTNTRLALFDRRNEGMALLRRQDYRNEDFTDLSAIVARFLEPGARLDAACFGVAGLVIDGMCRLTNRDWTIDAAALGTLLGAPTQLVNDVAAIAAGVVHLPEAGFASLQAGTRRWASGNIAVVAVGTGLGQAAAFWDGMRHLPFATEAGHADFAPVEPIEFELAAFLHARHGGHASYERVLSGPGIAAIADFLVQASGFEAPAPLAALSSADRPAEIVRLATQTDNLLAQATMDIFLTVLAREAGNAALRFLALGGVVLAGGIPPRLLALLRRPGFLDTFAGKGRFTPLLRSLPLLVATDADIALLGAAYVGADLLSPSDRVHGETDMRSL
jgi:glucokinase